MWASLSKQHTLEAATAARPRGQPTLLLVPGLPAQDGRGAAALSCHGGQPAPAQLAEPGTSSGNQESRNPTVSLMATAPPFSTPWSLRDGGGDASDSLPPALRPPPSPAPQLLPRHSRHLHLFGSHLHPSHLHPLTPSSLGSRDKRTNTLPGVKGGRVPRHALLISFCSLGLKVSGLQGTPALRPLPALCSRCPSNSTCNISNGSTSTNACSHLGKTFGIVHPDA